MIPSGVTLTITGNVYSTTNSTIIVERGAELIVDGGTLSSICDTWRGVEVHGNPFESQNNLTEQGLVRVINGGTIENAANAITTIKTDEFGNWDWNYTGGIVKADGAVFRNNWRAMQFLSYDDPITQDNQSYIYDCTFITDVDELNDGRNPYAFITMFEVDGVEILGNDFSNTGTSPANERGMGIISLDASYNVKAYCPGILLPGGCTAPLDYSTFNNLYRGISVLGGAGAGDANIDRAIFNDNVFGVFLLGANYAQITRSEFNIPVATNEFAGHDWNYGVHARGAWGYLLEDNEFNGTGGIGTGTNMAVYARHSGTVTGSEIYDNELINMGTGVQTIFNNTNLNIDCNYFEKGVDSDADIHAAFGMLGNQGLCNPFNAEDPQANVFFGICDNVTDWHLYRNPGAAIFEYNSYDPGFVGYQISCTEPGISGYVCITGTEAPTYIETDACPAISEDDYDTGLTKAKLSYVNYRGLANDALSIVDGGDTDALLDLIATGSNGQVKNGLLDASPYLSEKVLITYFNSNPPNGHLKQVALANSPLMPDVYTVLLGLELPNGIMSQIANAQGGEGPMEELMDEVNYYQGQKLFALNQITRLFLDGAQLDSAVYYLELDGTTEASCALVPVTLPKDTTKAGNHIAILRDVADEIEALKPFSAEASELRQFCDFYEKLFKAQTRLGSYYSLTAAERNKLEQFAVSGTLIENNAQAILQFLDLGKDYYEAEPYLYLNSMTADVEDETLKKDQDNMSVMPNPFSSRTTITGKLEMEYNVAIIEVLDISGRVVKQMPVLSDTFSMAFETEDSGIYLCNLIVDGVVLETKKIIATE